MKKSHSDYINLIKTLVLETYRYFPKSEQVFVQQQDNKCNFKDSRNVAEKALMNFKRSYEAKLIDYCKYLGIVYLAQDKAFESIEDPEVISKIKVLKMYIENPIPDHAFYDGIHTNKVGSNFIANYLLKNIEFN